MPAPPPRSCRPAQCERQAVERLGAIRCWPRPISPPVQPPTASTSKQALNTVRRFPIGFPPAGHSMRRSERSASAKRVSPRAQRQTAQARAATPAASPSARQSIENGNVDRAARDPRRRSVPIRFTRAYVSRGQAMFQLGRLTGRSPTSTGDPARSAQCGRHRARGMAQPTRATRCGACDLAKRSSWRRPTPRMPLDLFTHRNRAALSGKKQYDREIYDDRDDDAYWKDPLLADALRTNYRDRGGGASDRSPAAHAGAPRITRYGRATCSRPLTSNTRCVCAQRPPETLEREPAMLDFSVVNQPGARRSQDRAGPTEGPGLDELSGCLIARGAAPCRTRRPRG